MSGNGRPCPRRLGRPGLHFRPAQALSAAKERSAEAEGRNEGNCERERTHRDRLPVPVALGRLKCPVRRMVREVRSRKRSRN